MAGFVPVGSIWRQADRLTFIPTKMGCGTSLGGHLYTVVPPSTFGPVKGADPRRFVRPIPSAGGQKVLRSFQALPINDETIPQS